MTHSSQVLFVSHYAGRTGAPMVLLHFLRWLKQHSALTFEVLLQEGGVLEGEFAKLAPVHKLISSSSHAARSSLLVRIPRRLKRSLSPDPLDAFCRNRRWDLVYSNTIMNGQVVSRAAAGGSPVITHVHEMDHWIKRSGPENLEQVKQHTTRFIAASGAVKENLVAQHGIPEGRIDVVHAFIPVVEPPDRGNAAIQIRKTLGIPKNAFVLGGAGAEPWRKGRDLVAHLLVALRRRKPEADIHFIWVGPGGNQTEENEFWHDLKQAGVASRCHVTGEVSNPLDYFAATDAFALLSREDPFPLVCLEASSLAKPILCFAGAGGIPELVGADCGFAVPYLDIELMAERVMRLAQSPDECRRLGQHGAERVKAYFSVDVLAPKILEVIEQVVAPKSIMPARPPAVRLPAP